MVTRTATDSGNERPTNEIKRSPSDYFDDASKEVQWNDIERILANTETDDTEPGWISGEVFMVFGSKQKSETQIVSSGRMQLRICITCADFSLFKFTIRQPIKISLRGASIVKLKGGTSVPCYIPFYLVFKDGAVVKFVVGGKGIQDGEVVDSWQKLLKSEDWYVSSPVRDTANELPHPVCARKDSARISSSPSTPFPETPGRNEEFIPLVSSIAISNGDADEVEDVAMQQDALDVAEDAMALDGKVPAHNSDSGGEAALVGEHPRKKAKKRDTRHDYSRSLLVEYNAESGNAEPANGQKLSKGEKRRRKREHVKRAEQGPSPPRRDPALDLVAGIITDAGAYLPLEKIQPNRFCHVIGIVGSIEEPTRTRRGDFKVTTILIDPSRFQDGAGFKVTCFMKAGYEYLLPSAAKGHVLLLREVRAADWSKAVNGTVYAERLKWVAYNPDTGKVYYAKDSTEELNNPPQSFSALRVSYQPNAAEIQYLVQLGAWWRAVKEEEKRGAIQITEYSHTRLEHHLIGTCEVDKFFNATVEILRIEEADSGQTMLFFSDYTPHPQRSVEGYYGQWAMHASTSRIDPSLLDTMKTGTYWSINNTRLKIGSTGNLEADLFAASLHELQDDDIDRHLGELLKRKEVYLREHAPKTQDTRRDDHTESLISDVSEPGHYNVVAELLYRANVRDTVTDLYVTDYSENSLLSAFRPEGLKRKLNGSVTVLQVSAWDGDELVRDMEVGCIYTFSDVRIVNQHSGGLKGNLKFANKRITRMNVKRTDNPAILALLKRRNEVREGYPTSDSGGRSNSPLVQSPSEYKVPITISGAIKSRHRDQPQSTIREIKRTRKCPNKYRLVARIVDFLPLDISDFTVRMCSNCNRRIPDNHNACLMCEDMMEEYVRWIFRFFFVLEDEEGERLIIDGHTEAKYFLLGINPCDLRENRDTLWAVRRRLQSCLGNLVEVHDGLKRQELVKPQYGPYFDLAVKSWEIVNGDRKKVVYSLTGCEAVEQPR